jgi:hypothetical protein
MFNQRRRRIQSPRSRLAHALTAARPAVSDHSFVLAVLETAERERYRAVRTRLLLQTIGLGLCGAAATALAAPWLETHVAAFADASIRVFALLLAIRGLRTITGARRSAAA